MDFDSRTENLTRMEVRCLPMDDRHGRAVLVAIAKVSYEIDPIGNVHLARPATEIRLGAEYNGGSPLASIKYPSDYVDEKPGTDVIVVGTAIPPEGRHVIEMDVSVRVGKLHKAVRVFGTRVYQEALFGGLAPGPASLLGPTPIRYELAFGGADDTDPERYAEEPRNPAGMGFVETRHKRVGAPAPRIEIVQSVDKSRDPAGFGAIGPHWSPRAELAGTRDGLWRFTRSPIHPKDFDPRHNNVAHPDLWSATPLRPDEPVEIAGMTAEGVWRFRLPDVAPTFTSRREGAVREHETHLDTFLIDADERRAELTWRVAIPLPKKAQLLDRVTVRATGELPPNKPIESETTPEAA